MAKYVRRRLMKAYRKEGVPFIDACKLARIKEKFGFVSDLNQAFPDGNAKAVTYCDCCGPEVIEVTLSNGLRYQLSYYDFSVKGYFKP